MSIAPAVAAPRFDGRRSADFTSTGFLGFGTEPEILASVEAEVRRSGTHPSRSRPGGPALLPRIEDRLTMLLGAPDVLVLPTITHVHMSMLPMLAGRGHLFLDPEAHPAIGDGAMFARAMGATVKHFRDPDHLDTLLRATPTGEPRVVAMDGVGHRTGAVPDLPALLAVARAHGALLYIDDTNGFGVLGERSAEEYSPYGVSGNAVVRHHGETYDDVVLVGGFAHAYAAEPAFLALPTALKEHLKAAAPPYLYAGPAPTASLAAVLAGLGVNADRGDALRAGLHRRTRHVLDHLAGLGADVSTHPGTPILHLTLPADADRGLLDEHGVRLAAGSDGGVRAYLTAAHSWADIDLLCAALTALHAAGAELTRPGAPVRVG